MILIHLENDETILAPPVVSDYIIPESEVCVLEGPTAAAPPWGRNLRATPGVKLKEH